MDEHLKLKRLKLITPKLVAIDANYIITHATTAIVSLLT